MTTITPLPAPPSRASPADFAEKADAFLGAMPAMAVQMNAVAAETNAAAQTAINAPGTSATSATALTIGTGAKALVIQTGKALVVGQSVMIASTATPTNYMHGQITAYNAGTGALTVNVDATGGSGTINAWTISLSLPQIALPLSGGKVAGPLEVTGNIVFSAPTVTVTFGAGPTISTPAANQLAFGTSGSQRVFVDAAGYTTIHGARGSAGSGPGSGSLRVIAAAAGGFAVTTFNSQNYIAIQFLRDISGSTVQIGTIGVGETSVSYNTSSDYRLKTNVVPIAGALARLADLPVYQFEFIAVPGVIVDGFLAHEAQAVVPEAVTGEKDGIDADGFPLYQGIDQSKLVPLLTAALKELAARYEALEARVTALEDA